MVGGLGVSRMFHHRDNPQDINDPPALCFYLKVKNEAKQVFPGPLPAQYINHTDTPETTSPLFIHTSYKPRPRDLIVES